MSDTGWKYDEDKTEAENWQAYVDLVEKLEAEKAESYEEAGTLPPGVVNRNPDATTPEANYVSRDNIVVSGASPHHIQAAVENLGDDEVRRNALDAADVAQGATREDYEAAIKAVAPGATQDGPQETVELDDEPDGPKATGGTQPDSDDGDKPAPKSRKRS